jgi:hypothetical protein
LEGEREARQGEGEKVEFLQEKGQNAQILDGGTEKRTEDVGKRLVPLYNLLHHRFEPFLPLPPVSRRCFASSGFFEPSQLLLRLFGVVLSVLDGLSAQVVGGEEGLKVGKR